MPGKCVSLFLAALALPTIAFADCDFDKPVGRCTASVAVKKTYGSKPSFGAELSVQSSASYCSKVEFYVNSTPYETVLKNGSKGSESVFGTRPISKKDISLKGCTTYASVGKSSQRNTQGSSSESQASFDGTWSGSLRWTFVSDPTKITIRTHGNTASGSWYDGKTGQSIRFNGSISGNTLTFNYVAPGDGSRGVATMTMQGDNTASMSASAVGIVFSGTMTKN